MPLQMQSIFISEILDQTYVIYHKKERAKGCVDKKSVWES